MSRKALFLSGAVALVFAITAATTAIAQTEVSGGGLAFFIPHGMTEAEADGGSIARWASRGFVTSDDPDNPLNMVNFDCTGMNSTAADGTVTASGMCNGVDGDNDAYSLWWTGDGVGGDWGFFSGTGKFANAEGGGTHQQIHTWGDGKYVVRWEGTWTQ